MGDPYDGLDRRENMTGRRANNGEHCEAHVRNMERISKLEARTEEVESQADKLFEKVDKLVDTLNAIKMCVETLSNRQLTNHTELRNGIMTLEGKLDVYEERFEQRRAYADGVVEQARAKFEAVDERIKKLESFSWFRDRMTWVRDNLPWFVVYLILGALAALVIFHGASESFVKLLGKLLGAK